MKKITYILASVLLLTFTMGFTKVADWYIFDTKDFSITFPQKPDTKTQVLNTAIGDINMDLTMYAAEPTTDDNLVYGVIVSAYPENLISSDKKDILDGFFRKSIDGAIQNVKGKLLSEKPIELDGFPGREIRVDYENGVALIKMRMYLVKSKMIIQQLISTVEKENNASSSQFLNSLKLKK